MQRNIRNLVLSTTAVAGLALSFGAASHMDKDEPLRRFITGMPKERFTPAMGDATLCGVYVETDDRSGKAIRIRMVRDGGLLEPAGP